MLERAAWTFVQALLAVFVVSDLASTKTAVVKFQESQGFLKVNGVVDGDTFGALFLQ